MSLPHTSAIAKDAPEPSSSPARFGFDNTYARLPERFFAHGQLTPASAPKLIQINAALARQLGLDPAELSSEGGIQILAGNRVAEGSEPIALAYAGHQFGYFVPQLGDGRAMLLGEVVGRDGVRYDIQLKGSGPTFFSRRGDGRAAIGPVLREYIVSEAMAAMGVPTTRSLAAVWTGDRVFRETALPGAVLTRIAQSHLRVGTFQYFAARGDVEGTRTLADYAIARHYPEAAAAAQPYRAFLDAVIDRQARLIAQWMLLGFIHGVMNTDNSSIAGETIDYGPCAFMEAFHPGRVFSSIDSQGRYAYGNQPGIALWNMTRLAEALLPLLEQEAGGAEAALASAKKALEAFEPQFAVARAAGLLRKIGIHAAQEGDLALAEDLLDRMAAHGADFTLTFHRLCAASAGPQNDGPVRTLFSEPAAYDAWAVPWRQRLGQQGHPPEDVAAAMRATNPAFIPRNHLVEAVIQAAVSHQDFQPFEDLLDVVTHPFDDRPGCERYAAPAGPDERVTQTFCGT